MSAIECVVLFESLFGNCRLIAQQVASGLASNPDARVTLQRACDVSPNSLGVAEFLVVGVPTHFFGVPTAWTRRVARRFEGAPGSAATAALEPDATGPGVRELLTAVGPAPTGGRAAVFDTRLASPVAGSAAGPIGRMLGRLGWRVIGSPQHFIVTDMTGPLRDGELERARVWGAGLLPIV